MASDQAQVNRLIGVSDLSVLNFWGAKLPGRKKHLAPFVAPTANIPDIGVRVVPRAIARSAVVCDETKAIFSISKESGGWVIEHVTDESVRLPQAVLAAHFPTKETAVRAIASHCSRVNAVRKGLRPLRD